MPRYKVLTADAVVEGTTYQPGETLELDENVAAPLVEAGTVELVADATADATAEPAEPAATSGDESTAEQPTAPAAE